MIRTEKSGSEEKYAKIIPPSQGKGIKRNRKPNLKTIK